MADTSVKLSGTYDSIEAYNIMVEMQNMSADYEEIRTEAAAAASAATAAVTTAQTAANSASTYAGNAQTYAGNANSSASEAAGYASDASTAATNAASSETNASNSATAAHNSELAAAASEAVVNGALPLTGGTMTGVITLSGNQAIKNAANNDYVEINGGTGEETGAHLSVYGKDHATKGGNFTLEANDGVNSARLAGKPNGELTWNDNNVLTDGTTGNILWKSGTGSTTNTYVTLAEINQHDAGVWLIIGHIDCSTSFNNIYNNLLVYPNSPSNPARCSGQGGGGCYSVAVSYLAANAVVDLRGFIPSGVSTTMRGRLTMVRLA